MDTENTYNFVYLSFIILSLFIYLKKINVMVGVLLVLLGAYILAPAVVISGEGPNCVSAHSWRLNSAASLGAEAVVIMTRYTDALF